MLPLLALMPADVGYSLLLMLPALHVQSEGSSRVGFWAAVK